MDLFKYKVYCNTESAWTYVWSETEPTVCPNNNGHSIDISKTTIIDRILAADPRNNSGNAIIQITPIEGTKKTIITHNFADKCTWYQQATEVNDETLTDSGDHTTYEADYTHIIDLKHGRISGEDKITDVSDYYVVVEVDLVKNTEDTDYTVNYSNGTITFDSALSGTETVTMSYFYAGGSEYKITPESGKKIRILASEVNFSKNIVINDTAVFQIYVNDNLYDYDKYKNAKDYINGANEGQGEIPAFGELTQSIVVLPWKYPATIDLKSSLAMDLRISLENDTVFTGEVATLTLYCLVENES